MAKIKILVGTKNLDKLREIQQMVSNFDIVAVSLQQFHQIPDVEESGNNYEENAALKATGFSLAAGLPCISDDSGLEVDKLNGQPGIYSGRWAGVDGPGRYEANNRKLLRLLDATPLQERTARFVSVLVLACGDKILLSCRGECQGRITTAPRGDQGFGYDPVFEVIEYQKTFGELGSDIKNTISHRAKALAQFKDKLGSVRNLLAK